MTAESFFERSGGGFVATELSRGPWHNDFQHGGPPCALLARAMEQAALAGGWPHVARLTFELVRPVPLVGRIEVEVAVVRAGRLAGRLSASMTVAGRQVISASALALRTAEIPEPPGCVESPLPAPASCEPFTFPFFASTVGYHTAFDLRLVRGEFGAGPTVMWMRAQVPLVGGEVTSPLCRVVTAADSGNGVSPVLDWRKQSFINPDLTVAIARPMVGEWIALDARTDVTASAVGTAQTRLLDTSGLVGYGIQSLIIAPVGA